MDKVALPIVPQVSDDLLEHYALQMLKLKELAEDTPLDSTLFPFRDGLWSSRNRA